MSAAPTLFRVVREALRHPADFMVVDDGEMLFIVDATAASDWIADHGVPAFDDADAYTAFCDAVPHLHEFGAVGGAQQAQVFRVARLLKNAGAGFAYADEQDRRWMGLA